MILAIFSIEVFYIIRLKPNVAVTICTRTYLIRLKYYTDNAPTEQKVIFRNIGNSTRISSSIQMSIHVIIGMSAPIIFQIIWCYMYVII
jgi:hypothetical protein